MKDGKGRAQLVAGIFVMFGGFVGLGGTLTNDRAPAWEAAVSLAIIAAGGFLFFVSMRQGRNTEN